MFFRATLLLLLGFLGSGLRAQTPLENARRAQALLGAGVWSQVIVVTNETRAGVYPSKVHALVFELAGILWFYTDTDGTQSFSLHRGRLAEEKADFRPLLRDIDRGFSRWSVLPDSPPPAGNWNKPLKNGCFIESVVALRDRLLRRRQIQQPRLLSYFSCTGRGEEGHTVLAFDVDDKVEVFDPARPSARLVYPKESGRDALTLARGLEGRRVLRARYLPVPDGVPAAAVAKSDGEGSPPPPLPTRVGRRQRSASEDLL